jgi:threonine aldolase
MIDLRSDTVTQPTAAMRKAMAEAEVGDDVYGDDPTVNRLESIAADLLGKEAAILATSGTQSNLMAVLSHCERGEEYIVGQQAHTYRCEAGGAAVLGSIQPQPLDFDPDGSLELTKVAKTVKPDDFHFARTKLLCLENTQGGKVLPLDYLEEAKKVAERFSLGLHLDGARLFNAAVKMNVQPTAIARHFDTISICLSKGLGAPVGSVLCGPKELIKKARRWRKMLGGGMRQAGILAAAGILALENHVDRLQEDHENASYMAEILSEMDELNVDQTLVQTNMVFMGLRQGDPARLQDYLRKKGVLINTGDPIRMVTHMDVSRQDIETAVDKIKEYFKSR